MPAPEQDIDRDCLETAFEALRVQLLNERNVAGHWVGELSTSALSTATAVMALEQVRRDRSRRDGARRDVDKGGESGEELLPFIARGAEWLIAHQNEDGGWGDTLKSYSNISTTMLCRASLVAAGWGETDARGTEAVTRAAGYIEQAGGVPALKKRYGKDKTFSVPILTHCALAGLAEWREIPALPFELACVPARWYAAMRLPVVSYALPALIAIGQVRHHFAPTRNPAARLLRNSTREASLRVLSRIQPENGGFLEATPLTSFVTMSLAGMGRADHPVAVKGVEFILKSALPDGSWPIDTNLATWVTTLAVNALRDDLPEESRGVVRDWLLGQQNRVVHPFTNAAPGGWAWTDLPGGVPDADDTPGALLALMHLEGGRSPEVDRAIGDGVGWLLGLQNRDGGFPTFCRGWGALPFDRSSPDITAHCVRALLRQESPRTVDSVRRAFAFLRKVQRRDGSWLPLWFGNQDAPDDINPTYGTARVLAAFRDAGLREDPACRRGVEWLWANQNTDGGWGGQKGIRSSVEETALAVEILVSLGEKGPGISAGICWLIDRVEADKIKEAAPIGFYFAKLWYFERLYPLVFAVGALRSVREGLMEPAQTGHDGEACRSDDSLGVLLKRDLAAEAFPSG